MCRVDASVDESLIPSFLHAARVCSGARPRLGAGAVRHSAPRYPCLVVHGEQARSPGRAVAATPEVRSPTLESTLPLIIPTALLRDLSGSGPIPSDAKLGEALPGPAGQPDDARHHAALHAAQPLRR